MAAACFHKVLSKKTSAMHRKFIVLYVAIFYFRTSKNSSILKFSYNCTHISTCFDMVLHHTHCENPIFTGLGWCPIVNHFC